MSSVPVLGSYGERASKVGQRALPAFAFPNPRASLRSKRIMEFLKSVEPGEAAEDIDALRASLRRPNVTRRLVARALSTAGHTATRTISLSPHDVQLFAAWTMLQGSAVEMETGEGKTLVAALVAGVHGLAGRAVHVVTSNDYLAERDAEAMGPLLAALGLSVACVRGGDADDIRRRSYGADVVYVTAKCLMFDYLRDRLALGELGGSQLRTELAVLRAEAAGRRPFFLRGLQAAVVDEADSIFIDDAAVPLIISVPKPDREQAEIAARAIALVGALTQGRDFSLDPAARTVGLTDAGRQRLAELARTAGPIFAGARWREHYANQALTAVHVFLRDRDYIIQNGAIAIVDAGTGRAMADRSWERGLHQMVQAKEGIDVTAPGEAVARITHQSFFQRYRHISGMSGTLWEARREIDSVYGLPTVRIPPHRKRRRRNLGSKVLATIGSQTVAIVERAKLMQAMGRPVLIGSRSVAASERLSEALSRAGVVHQILNARSEREEAEIIAGAGNARRITVATAMAGRGTDIRICAEAAAAGGLHVIATERHEARRVDRQLFGRTARQGDPGSFEEILCLEDEIVQRHIPLWIRRLAQHAPLPGLRRALLALAQIRIARRQQSVRAALCRAEAAEAALLGFSGRDGARR